jgi:arylsulfatase A-like enzyme
VLEVAGLPEPAQVNGINQEPMHGVSMAYSFDGADEPDRHETQYFEMFGNRGIYHKGWTAVTKHKTPGSWSVRRRPPSTTTAGSCTTPPPTGVRPTTCPRSIPTSCTSCSGCG